MKLTRARPKVVLPDPVAPLMTMFYALANCQRMEIPVAALRAQRKELALHGVEPGQHGVVERH